MPTLFPPLEQFASTGTTNVSAKSSFMPPSNRDDESSVGDLDGLPPEITRNFATIRYLLAKPNDNTKTKRENEGTHDNMPDLKKRKAAEDLAIATALAVEHEVALLQSGIGELEALLAATGQGTGSRYPESAFLRGRNGFPSLPPVVPDDDIPERSMYCSGDVPHVAKELSVDGHYRTMAMKEEGPTFKID